MDLTFGEDTLTFDGATPTWTDGVVTLVVWEAATDQWSAKVSVNPGTYGDNPITVEIGTYQPTPQEALDQVPAAWRDNASAVMNAYVATLVAKDTWLVGIANS